MKLQGKVVQVSEADEYGDTVRIVVDIQKRKIPREPDTSMFPDEQYKKNFEYWEARTKEILIQHQNIRMLGLCPITIEAENEVVIQ